LPELYQKMGFDDDAAWRQWYETNECEKSFPSDKPLKLFQQLLVIQALRPDRLQTAMREFACKLLNIKDISPSSINIRHIYESETSALEPILIIISPGSDPSEELRELAINVVGRESYQEVRKLNLIRIKMNRFYSSMIQILYALTYLPTRWRWDKGKWILRLIY
jgi:dynein heavy chain 2, cytosolic